CCFMSYFARIACLNCVSAALSAANRFGLTSAHVSASRPPSAFLTVSERFISGYLQQLFDRALAFGPGAFPHLGALEFRMRKADPAVACANDLARRRLPILAKGEIRRA